MGPADELENPSAAVGATAKPICVMVAHPIHPLADWTRSKKALFNAYQPAVCARTGASLVQPLFGLCNRRTVHFNGVIVVFGAQARRIELLLIHGVRFGP